MRIFITLLSCLAIALFCKGEEPKYSYLTGEFDSAEASALPADMVKTDYAGDTVSVVLVKSMLDDLTFVGNVFGEPTRTFKNGWEYAVNVTRGSRNLTVQSERYHQVRLEFPHAIGGNELWVVTVHGKDAPRAEMVEIGAGEDYSHDVWIDAEDFVNLYIDEDLAERGPKHRLDEGVHYIRSDYRGKTYYKQTVNVTGPRQRVDARVGGTLRVKDATEKNYTINPLPGSTTPKKKVGEEKNEYGEMLGEYYVEGSSNDFTTRKILRKISVSPRSNTVFRFGDMYTYGYAYYHGTNKAPIGVTVGVGRKWGVVASVCFNIVDTVQTKYGENVFEEAYQGTKYTSRGTVMTVTAGPMVRFGKFIVQAEAGWTRYLSTSEPKILTADYHYKSTVSASTTVHYNWRGFIIGLGYMHTFGVSQAYDRGLSHQLTFAAGFRFGL